MSAAHNFGAVVCDPGTSTAGLKEACHTDFGAGVCDPGTSTAGLKEASHTDFGAVVCDPGRSTAGLKEASHERTTIAGASYPNHTMNCEMER
jgi:hypothetical protein